MQYAVFLSIIHARMHRKVLIRWVVLANPVGELEQRKEKKSQIVRALRVPAGGAAKLEE